MAQLGKRASVARTILLGVIILAVAAVIVAWMDQTGLFDEAIRAFEKGRYGN